MILWVCKNLNWNVNTNEKFYSAKFDKKLKNKFEIIFRFCVVNLNKFAFFYFRDSYILMNSLKIKKYLRNKVQTNIAEIFGYSIFAEFTHDKSKNKHLF